MAVISASWLIDVGMCWSMLLSFELQVLVLIHT